MFIAIVPALNEETNIGSVVRDLFCHVDSVVVVDDGSTDATAAVAEAAGALVLRHQVNRGQGAALQTGHEYARSIGAEYVLHFDADRQFDVKDVLPALEAMKAANADILFGSRFISGTELRMPWAKKHILFPIAKLVNRMFSSIHLADTHNGFRILNSKALSSIEITQDRMAHATEIITQTGKNNLSYLEFPVTVYYHEYGQGFSGGVKVVKDLVIGSLLSKKK